MAAASFPPGIFLCDATKAVLRTLSVLPCGTTGITLCGCSLRYSNPASTPKPGQTRNNPLPPYLRTHSPTFLPSFPTVR